MSIRVRFILVIGIVSLIASVALAFLSYRFSVNNALEEAQKQGDIIVNYIDASWAFFLKEQRPLTMELVEEDRFYPELMSGFALNRGVWKHFSKKMPDFILHQASLDPRFPSNKATDKEEIIISSFQKNNTLKKKEGIIEKDGMKYFYFARPARVKENCLRCHGEPENAPKDLLDIYGSENAFHWKVGETVSTFLVYVPIQKALENARKSAVLLFSAGVGGIVIMMLVIWAFFNKYVVTPIARLEKMATDISLGRNLGSSVPISSNDEISSLARSLDRLRISIQKMLKRCR